MDPKGSVLDVRGSYAKKFAGLVVATLVLTASVGAVIHTTVDTEIRDDTRESLRTNAELEAQELDNWFALTDRQLESLPRSVAFRTGDAFHASDQLHAVAAREAVSGVYFVNVSSRATIARAGSGEALTDDERLRPAVRERAVEMGDDGSHRVAYSEPYRSEATGDPRMLVMSRAPSHPDRAVLATVDLRALSRQTLGSDPRGDHRVKVVSRSGDVVLSRDTREVLSEDAVAPARFDGENGTVTAAPGGGERLAVGYATSDAVDWVVTRRVPTESAYSLASTVSTQILGLLAVVLACLGVVGLTLGRNTVRSVRDLSERAQALRDGDLETPIESDRRDEFGDLYDAFDDMRESLRERIDEVERAQKRAEVARDEVMETNDYLERTAESYSEAMGRAAAGDLTRRLETDGRNDAMDAIARDCNEMLAELEKTIGQLQGFADTVDESGEVVAASAASVRDAAEQVATSIQKVSEDARTQHEGLEAAADDVADAVEALEAGDVAAARTRLDGVAATLEDVADRTDRTMAEAETVAAAAEEQAAELTEVSQRAEELLRYVEPLSDVLGRFETEESHEFFFPSGPGNRPQVDD